MGAWHIVCFTLVLVSILLLSFWFQVVVAIGPIQMEIMFIDSKSLICCYNSIALLNLVMVGQICILAKGMICNIVDAIGQ